MEVEMKIRGLMVDPVTNMPIVVLKDVNGLAILPIWVGVYEANAIALEIDKQAFFRETGGAQDSVGAGHYRCPDDRQFSAANRQIAGLQPVNSHKRHLGGACDAVEKNRSFFAGT